ncbi:MAG TPA: ATP-binding protein [Anaerolineales bacterium]|nr:ATP-binding protein [Anaerolineales bacterium]
MNNPDSIIVRILGTDGQPVGVGILISTNLVITCAHVVQTSTGSIELGVSLQLDLPLAESQRRSSGQVVFLDQNKDIACIETNTPMSVGSGPARLVIGDNLWGHTFRVFGFPPGHQSGVWASGLLRSSTGDNWIQMEDIKNTGFAIQRGFSGGPVWDDQLQAVVGMVIAAESDKSVKAAFCIPAQELINIYPKLMEYSSLLCPYRSLDIFTESDKQFFFGRDRALEKLLGSIKREPRFVAILGPSGSGKSSLVRAGLVSALKDGRIIGSEKWEILIIRPGEQPFLQLENAGLTNPHLGLNASISQWQSNNSLITRLVIFIDQFEELFTITPVNIRKSFISEIVEALESSPSISLIIALRDDFYSRFFQEAPSLATWLERGLVNIPSTIEMDELHAIIASPALQLGVRFEDGLVDNIIISAREVDRSQELARSAILPLLEFALTQLWNKRQGGLLTHRVYQSIGGVSGGLSQWADKAYYELDLEERKIARRIRTELVSFGDPLQGIPNTKRLRYYSEIADSELAERVVQKLIHARLLVASHHRSSKQGSVEIIHEALIYQWTLFSQWIQEDSDYFRLYRPFVEDVRDWENARRDAGLLYRGTRLARHIQLVESNSEKQIGSLEKEFLDASIKQQESEKLMERSQAALEIMTQSHYGMLETDANNVISLFNTAAEQIFALSSSRIVGQPIDILTRLLGEKTQSIVQAILDWSESPISYQPGESYAEEMTLENEKIVLVHAAPVILQNEFQGTVSTFRDITHEVEVDKLKSEFVATVSHELRTPMTSIRAYVDVLLMGAAGALNENQAHFLNIIKNNTERLNILVNDLLDVSRIESGRVTLSLQALDLREIAEDAIGDVLRRSHEENKPMAFSLDAPKKLPYIYGDVERVRQIFGNLVDNAYHYTPENGSVIVRIHSADRGEEVQVDVMDNGIGIPLEDQTRVFERFYRGEHPLVLSTPGTGLGLSIVKQIVEMHKGRIWMKSTGVPGDGSTFSFTLPIHKVA